MKNPEEKKISRRGKHMRHYLILLFVGIMTLMAMPATAQSDPFLGEVDLVAFNFAPKGWAMCQGQLLAINQNQALFSLLGTTFGGDGRVTFALPDLRGRRIVGQGQGQGLSPYTMGQRGGEEAVTLNISQIPSHTHQVQASMAVGTTGSPTGGYWASQTSTNLYSNAPTSTVALSPLAIGSAGGGQPHDNMPPYLVLNYIIALQGIFPSQN